MSKQAARRSLKFDCLRETLAEVDRLNDSGYTMVGNWNLGKACQHLSKTMRMSIEGAPFSLPFFLKPVARKLLFGKIMSGAPTRLPLKTVRQFRPDVLVDTDHEISEYQRLVNQIMDDDASLLSNHPLFGKVTLAQWRTFHAWHSAHHFSFLIPMPSNSPTQSAIMEPLTNA